jgi:amidohydrolase
MPILRASAPARMTLPDGLAPSPPDAPLPLDAQLTALRRALHRHPEVGFDEHATAARVEETLRALGLQPRRVAGTGLIVDIEGAAPGPVRAYRADLDALPIQDAKTDVPYASAVPGVAHLCGHDAHTAIGVGVARLVHEQRGALAGTVRVFFQPNEEGTPSGAPRMIAAGVLDGVQAVFGVHVDPTLRVGEYGLITGPVTASFDQVDIVVRTPATLHSARPHLSADAVWLASALLQHLYTLAGRVTDARYPAVLAVTQLHAGGAAYNVIPDEVRLGGTLRCLDATVRARMQAAIREAATAFTAPHGATAAVSFLDGAPSLINDAALVEHVAAVAVRCYGEPSLAFYSVPSMGAEDFAHYTERVPGAFVRVGTQSSARTAYPVHHALFDLDEAALAPAARLMAEVLMSYRA